MTTRRCRFCAHFYDKRDSRCPECGTPPYAYNTALVSQRFATALNEKAARAVRDG